MPEKEEQDHAKSIEIQGRDAECGQPESNQEPRHEHR